MKNPFLNTRFLISETDPLRLSRSKVDVAFVGRSNAGKSSLICALCKNKKLARVSKTPGRTRSVNVFEVRRDFWLIDLPGYGFSDAPEKMRDYWPKMLGMVLGGRSSLMRVYVLLDAERGVMPIDLSMIAWLRENKIPFVLVGTKVDRIPFSKHKEARAKMAQGAGFFPNEIFWVSAKMGDGLNEFARNVEDALKM